jgi:hypothetical protein
MSKLTATCHCGAVTIEVARRPRRLSECNCSICRRYGARWAYYRAIEVKLIAKRGALDKYVWGDKSLRFVRCARCGCVTHWEAVQRQPGSRMGVNARNFPPSEVANVRVRLFDGAVTWKMLT